MRHRRGRTAEECGDEVTLTLNFEDVEFIALEMPHNDGFTKDWWKLVYQPMLAKREVEANR